ncbi:formin-like protein 14 [Miscanthus floridulus]|uniref:formin-like protein 14 n=1 Tax=Miscanthus floridulus TaxID=154761 RepID=UPI00345A4504
MPLPPPPSFFLLLSLLLLPAATISTTQTNATLPSPPPPPAAPHPPRRHHHTASPRAPLTPPPPPSLPPPPPHPTPTPVAVPPAPPPTPTPTPAPPVTTSPTPKYPSSSATPSTGDPYPFTNNPFFPTANSPPPPPPAAETQPSGDGGLPTFPANISTLVAPTPRASGSHRFPVLQALLLSLLSLCLLLLSALLSIHLVRRLRHRGGGGRSGAAASSASAAHRRAASNHDDDDDGDEEGRSLKPPPMPTSSTNPSTEFLYLGTLATPPPSGPQHPGTSSNLRPGSPELRPLPPLPRVGPPSGEFASRSSASDPSTVPPAAAADVSSSSLSPSSPSASSPTLGSSPVHFRPPSIPQPRGRAPNPSPPKRRPSPPKGAAELVAAHAWNPFVPLPPRPAVASSDDGDSDQMMDLRKSRPLHSDKLKPGSLHMKDEVIQLYLNNSAAVAAPREVCLLGALRCHGIGMIVGALGVSKEQLRDALLEGNAHGLGVEALRMLTQMVLSNEEELKLKYFKDDSQTRLCPVDAFLKAMLDVPFAFKRVDAMLYIASFYLEINQLRMSYATLEGACQEMSSSRLFHKVLEAVVNFGNFMNTNSGSPCSKGLEPNTVLKIADVKGADGKAALMQFLVQEIVKPEGYNVMEDGSGTCKMNTSTLQYDAECRKHGLEVVTKLAAELSTTKKAASIDITRLSRSVSELGMGLGKVHDVVRLNSMVTSAESTRRFHNSMSTFLRHAEEEILKLQSQESICLSSVKEIAEWFIRELGNDEAHMFRIFAGVREFLAMLDRICKEAGEVNSNNWVGATTASWMAAPMGMTP